MFKKCIALLVVVFAVSSFASSATASENWPSEKPYTAASIGINLNTPVSSGQIAGGGLDCATGTGGACFGTQGHEGTTFSVGATDDNSETVSFFMGFDVDGDGCVACTAGDITFSGTDTVTGFVPSGPFSDRTLYVFVRAANANSADVATTGVLNIAGCRQSPAQGCNITEEEIREICVGGPAGGACGDVPYPYQSNGGGSDGSGTP